MNRLFAQGALFAALCFSAYAAPISVGTWYLGSFDATIGAPVTGGGAGGGALDPGAPAWTFNLGASSGVIKVIDCCLAGDRFSVFDSGGLLGVTSASLIGGCVTAAACDSLAGVGRGDFLLGPGAHSITMTVFATNGQAGNNFFRVDASAVPEPGSIFLGLAGLAAVAVLRRRSV